MLIIQPGTQRQRQTEGGVKRGREMRRKSGLTRKKRERKRKLREWYILRSMSNSICFFDTYFKLDKATDIDNKAKIWGI